MIRRLLSGEDAAERAQFLSFAVRLGVFGFILLALGEAKAVEAGWISPGMMALLLFLNLPFLAGLALVGYAMIDRSASAFTNTVLGAGNLKPEPAHSGCESLVARGFYREAVGAYRQFITEHPDDNLARIKLADVHRRHLGEPEEAERLFLEVRRQGADPRYEFLAWNLLIELYREMGRTDRLIVELARFADRYRATRAGRDAARLLRELKADRAREQP